MTGLDLRLRDVEVVVASDVDNPLTGDRGAAAVYGPQKGAGPADVQELEQALSQLASVIAGQLGVDLAGLAGTGAAGGTAGGTVAFLGASIVSGIDLLLDLAHFPTAVRTAHLIITGEGSLVPAEPGGQSAVGRRAGRGTGGRPGRRARRPVRPARRGGPGGRLRRGARADTPRTGRGALPAGRVNPFGVARPAPRRNLAAVSCRRGAARVW